MEKKFQELFYDLKNPSAYAGSHVFVRQTRKKKFPTKMLYSGFMSKTPTIYTED